ncbi:MAG: ribosomal protein L7/L12 [Planctomycetales bacterium]|nr:ribosomal protein L7/L12 [Planctomycetales bacterium]
MRHCHHCQQSVSDSAHFCEHCGGVLSDETSPGAVVEGQVRQLLADGRKIEAIRIYREATKVGLAEAKYAVEELERNASTDVSKHDDDSDEDLLQLLREGEKIEAIKRHRGRTGAGLKESKDYVEALAARHGIADPRVGCFGMLLGIAIAIGVGTWLTV